MLCILPVDVEHVDAEPIDVDGKTSVWKGEHGNFISISSAAGKSGKLKYSINSGLFVRCQ